MRAAANRGITFLVFSALMIPVAPAWPFFSRLLIRRKKVAPVSRLANHFASLSCNSRFELRQYFSQCYATAPFRKKELRAAAGTGSQCMLKCNYAEMLLHSRAAAKPSRKSEMQIIPQQYYHCGPNSQRARSALVNVRVRTACKIAPPAHCGRNKCKSAHFLFV